MEAAAFHQGRLMSVGVWSGCVPALINSICVEDRKDENRLLQTNYHVTWHEHMRVKH